MAAASDNSLKVLFLASEADPFYKVGGLGDYAGSLPAALRVIGEKRGLPIDIRVGLPFHKSIAVDPSSFRKVCDLKVPKKNGWAKGSAYLHTRDGIPYYFIRRAGKAGGFSSVYTNAPLQDARKFIFFSLASLELVKCLNWQPDIIHVNDWHTALAAYYLKHTLSKQPFYNPMRSLLVIHNLPFMGAGSEDALVEFGIPAIQSDILPDWSKHFPLIMGMDSADEIASVSPSYMAELKKEEFGNGLRNYFIANERKTTGILNGIDTHAWNPATDAIITDHFDIHDLSGKRQNKRQVLHTAGFNADDPRPLLVAVTRLDIQKGTDLILSVITKILNKDWNMIILGSGSPGYEKSFSDLQSRHPERIHVYLQFNAVLAHKLYAAGDIFLMPSRYEPCGLSQMIAMRYGCPPVARAVGGLRDTITAKPESERSGYLFEEASAEAFSTSLCQALSDYQDKQKWHTIQLNGMKKDFSWEKSAVQYLQVYSDLKKRSG